MRSNFIEVNEVDEDWFKQLSRMDGDTLRHLMEKYGEDIWNYAYFLTKRHEAADDISQEVFVKAYMHIGSFRGECSIKTWLLTITRRQSFNHLQSAYWRKVTLMDLVSRKDTAASAEQQAMDRMMTDRLWETVLSLPVKYREVLVLEAHYSMPMREMAELLGIRLGTVKSRLNRARAKVGEALKEGIEYGSV
ncbi:RNA polymerase sigma factor [Paenibacillus koleovorans]|uniref:RNA polymerase sigma factor n=1 Tax=Paenibacillus koleovorans TaxID=121608 RepID=UPI000FD79E84|nr:sigma-70 family RNA polymerase sigma factor [Paenibacillus koleovorans]